MKTIVNIIDTFPSRVDVLMGKEPDYLAKLFRLSDYLDKIMEELTLGGLEDLVALYLDKEAGTYCICRLEEISCTGGVVNHGNPSCDVKEKLNARHER